MKMELTSPQAHSTYFQLYWSAKCLLSSVECSTKSIQSLMSERVKEIMACIERNLLGLKEMV